MGFYLAPAPAVALELRHNLNYDGGRDEQRTRRSADCLGGHRSAGADVPIERTETGAHSFRRTDLFSPGAGDCCGCDEGSSAGPLNADAAIAFCLTSAAFNCSLVRIPASMSAPFRAPISTLISLISRSTQCGSAPTGLSPFNEPGSFGSKGRHSISGSTAGPLLLASDCLGNSRCHEQHEDGASDESCYARFSDRRKANRDEPERTDAKAPGDAARYRRLEHSSHLPGRAPLLGRRAEDVRTEVVAGDAGGSLDSQAVMGRHGSASARPLPDQCRLNPDRLSECALAAGLVDRDSNWAVHARTIALLSRQCNSVARGVRRTV